MSELPSSTRIEKTKHSRKLRRIIGGVALAASLVTPMPGTDTSPIKATVEAGNIIDVGVQKLIRESTGVLGAIIPGNDVLEQIHNSNDTSHNIDTNSARYFKELNK